MLVPLHDCFGYHYVLPRHSYTLEDHGAVCAKRPSASDDIHHRDQLVGAKMALAHRQDDVPGFPQRRAYVFDDDIGAAHQGTVQLTSLRLMGSDCDHDRGVGQVHGVKQRGTGAGSAYHHIRSLKPRDREWIRGRDNGGA
jgi:hypothetical protein